MAYRVLEVTLESATELKNVNLFTRMEVYAVATISGDPITRQCTPTDTYGGRNPTWNATLRFVVPPTDDAAAGKVLHVLLRSEGYLLSDRDVGEVVVPLAEILASAGPDDLGPRGTQFASFLVHKVHRAETRGVLHMSYRVGPVVAPAPPAPRAVVDSYLVPPLLPPPRLHEAATTPQKPAGYTAVVPPSPKPAVHVACRPPSPKPAEHVTMPPSPKPAVHVPRPPPEKTAGHTAMPPFPRPAVHATVPPSPKSAVHATVPPSPKPAVHATVPPSPRPAVHVPVPPSPRPAVPPSPKPAVHVAAPPSPKPAVHVSVPPSPRPAAHVPVPPSPKQAFHIPVLSPNPSGREAIPASLAKPAGHFVAAASPPQKPGAGHVAASPPPKPAGHIAMPSPAKPAGHAPAAASAPATAKNNGYQIRMVLAAEISGES